VRGGKVADPGDLAAEGAALILGMGADLCDIRRVERAIARFGDRFLDRVFTPAERAKAERRTQAIRAATYAKRFAAKEACAKALGTGFSRGVFMQDLGVVNLDTGQPTMALTGGALRRLNALTPPGYRVQVALTLTDEHPYAFAQVLLQATRARTLDEARLTGAEVSA
jgi:holo-[acyl-carrier protein] synthase